MTDLDLTAPATLVDTPLSDETRDRLVLETWQYARQTAQDAAAMREIVERVADEVQPTIESIMAHPMLAMLMRGIKA